MINAGIDIGGTNIKIGLIDTDICKLLAKTIIPFERSKTNNEIIDRIKDEVFALSAKNNIEYERIFAIGVCVPGSIDPLGEIVLNAHNLGFHDFNIKNELKRVFPNKQIMIANDADAATLAELKYGALIGTHTSMLLTIGTGLGGGLILNGELFKGGQKNGVEPGHIIIDINGRSCTCNNRGCAETLCSATWLTEQGRIASKRYPDSFLAMRERETQTPINAKTVIDGVKLGDEISMSILNEFTDNLSSAIASICNILDPEKIAIGGGIGMSGDVLFVPLRIKVQDKSFFNHEYEIVPAVMGNDAGMLGAALLLS